MRIPVRPLKTVPDLESVLGFVVTVIMSPWADFEARDRNQESCFIHACVLSA